MLETACTKRAVHALRAIPMDSSMLCDQMLVYVHVRSTLGHETAGIVKVQ
jgi:hypothetical protein